MLYMLNFREQKFTSFKDMTKVKSSMELDSGVKICQLDWGPFVATIEVSGLVDVTYQGNVYRQASKMPKKLRDMFHNWKYEYTQTVDIDSNNWFEVFLYYKDGKKLQWTGHSDVVDAEGLDDKMLKRILVEYIDETTEEYIVKHY